MPKHRSYSSDIKIPNLDAMSLSDVETFGRQPRTGNPAFSLAIRYAKHKAEAMKARLRGDIASATYHERICDNLYDQIPQRMKW